MGTDGGLFTQIANVPTIVFGPGETKVAHYPNEYIEVDKMIVPQNYCMYITRLV